MLFLWSLQSVDFFLASCKVETQGVSPCGTYFRILGFTLDLCFHSLLGSCSGPQRFHSFLLQPLEDPCRGSWTLLQMILVFLSLCAASYLDRLLLACSNFQNLTVVPRSKRVCWCFSFGGGRGRRRARRGEVWGGEGLPIMYGHSWRHPHMEGLLLMTCNFFQRRTHVLAFFLRVG